MEKDKKIVIGNRIISREELFREKEKSRRDRSRMPFEKKIKALAELQKIARGWGGKKDVIVWM